MVSSAALAPTPQRRLFGCHVSSAGGLTESLKIAAKLDVTAIQVHPSPPQRWNHKPFESSAAQLFREARAGHCVERVFFHAIYLINLASGSEEQVKRSQDSLVHYLAHNGAIEGSGVIVHVGSLKDHADEAAGLKYAADNINRLLERAPEGAPLLLEVAAGSGAIVGDRFEELAEIVSHVDQQARIGYALDTQHMWASGYDLGNDCEGVVKQIGDILGFERIHCIHVNDSKVELASRRDRHENLGDGTIGFDRLHRFLNDERLSHIPCVLETPGLKELETAAVEVEKLRRLLGLA